MINISDLTIEELTKYIEDLGEKKFHAKQVFKWIHKFNVEDFEEMTDLSKTLREKLVKNATITKLQVIDMQVSKDGTRKFLIKLLDQNAIEAVFMKYNHGNTLCVSTQVGCRMGCKFCASTKDGFVRNLSASEIEYQVHTIHKYLNEKVSNVVYMGIGEPLDNFDNVIKSIENISSHEGIGIGARHISISTSGIVPNIYKLADLKPQATLSISLHATTDKKRQEIMPIAKKYDLKSLIEACRYYIIQTKRRISFEYALISGVNDSKEEAQELAKLLRGMIAHVNLICVNEIKDSIYKKSKEANIKEFMDILNKHGIVTTVRRELGKDIDGACGQLRQRYIDEEK